MPAPAVIAFDADDTLWHSESVYARAQETFAQILEPYAPAGDVGARLLETERRNLSLFGFGVKSFTLSLIETAIELTGGRILGRDVQRVIDLARMMLTADVQLLEGAAETVARLAASFPLMLVTKGDLLDQEAKLERSGLSPHFKHVEILSDKTRERYAALLARYRVEPARFLMVGNSLKSDILPVVELGGQAVYIPYAITWAHEVAPVPAGEAKPYLELENLGQLPALIEALGARLSEQGA